MGKNEQKVVTMRIKIGDKEFEITAPANLAEKKINEFIENQQKIESKPDDSPQGPKRSELHLKSESEAQFFKKIPSKTANDRVVSSAYYLEKIKKLDKYTSTEIKETISKARIVPPKNTTEALNQNIKKGYMMSAGDKEGRSAFVLTNDGEEYIQSLLNQ